MIATIANSKVFPAFKSINLEDCQFSLNQIGYSRSEIKKKKFGKIILNAEFINGGQKCKVRHHAFSAVLL